MWRHCDAQYYRYTLYYFTDLPRFYVNVSMPTYIKDNEFAIAGLVTAK